MAANESAPSSRGNSDGRDQNQNQNKREQSEAAHQSANNETRSGSNNNKYKLGGNESVENDQNICRDFLNNVCHRGSRCKYDHPIGLGGGNGQGQGQLTKEEVLFCNDFQNRSCARETCRYVHCAREDAEFYMQTGQITNQLARAIVAATGQETVDGRPLCKEFMSGKCSRGSRCRFWHINPREERELRFLERRKGGSGSFAADNGGSYSRYPQYAVYDAPSKRKSYYSNYDVDPEFEGFDEMLPPKRGRFAVNAGYSAISAYPQPMMSSMVPAHMPRETKTQSNILQSCTILVEDNAVLRRKIEILKQTLADMKAANEALIGENAHLRAKTVSTAATVTDQAIAAASIASAAAISSVLSSSVAGLASQALAPAPASGLTPEQHLAAVSLAAAAQQQPAVVVHPSIAMSAPSDVVQWSVPQMRL